MFARLRRILVCAVLGLLVLAPSAFAHAGGGEGWYGATTDQDVTNIMFLTIIFFPTVILLFSLIQWRLDKRREERLHSEKRRAVNPEWRGGW
jgi:hypothetical protein